MLLYACQTLGVSDFYFASARVLTTHAIFQTIKTPEDHAKAREPSRVVRNEPINAKYSCGIQVHNWLLLHQQ